MINEEILQGSAEAEKAHVDSRPETPLAGGDIVTTPELKAVADPSSSRDELAAMGKAYDALEGLSQARRNSAMQWLTRALKIESPASFSATQASLGGSIGQYPTDPEPPTPREFISSKRPSSQVERVACLAFFLTRYRGIQNFKAADIAALNTEAAAPKFGNASRDLDNADRQYGFIVSSGGGAKQLTVRGEKVVEALPNRDAVEQALAEHEHRRKRSTGSSRKASRSGNGNENA
jgi:hypothetical protein